MNNNHNNNSSAILKRILILFLALLLICLSIFLAFYFFISFPAHQSFTLKARAGELVIKGNYLKQFVENYWYANGSFPNSIDDFQLQPNVRSEIISPKNSYIHDINISSGGSIIISASLELGEDNFGKTIIFSPQIVNNKIIWDCTGGTFSQEYRIASCRKKSEFANREQLGFQDANQNKIDERYCASQISKKPEVYMTTNNKDMDLALVELKDIIMESWPENSQQVTHDIAFHPDGTSFSSYSNFIQNNVENSYYDYLNTMPTAQRQFDDMLYKLLDLYNSCNKNFNKVRLIVFYDGTYEIKSKFDHKCDCYYKLTDYSDPEYLKLPSDYLTNIQRWDGITDD